MINQVLSFSGDQLFELLLYHKGHWSISQMHILEALLTAGLGDLRDFWETLSKKVSHRAALPDCGRSFQQQKDLHVTHNLSKYQVSNDMIILLHPSMLITLFCRHAIIGRLGAQIALTMLWLHYHRTGYKHNNNVTLLCFIRCKKWHIHPVYSATLLLWKLVKRVHLLFLQY